MSVSNQICCNFNGGFSTPGLGIQTWGRSPRIDLFDSPSMGFYQLPIGTYRFNIVVARHCSRRYMETDFLCMLLPDFGTLFQATTKCQNARITSPFLQRAKDDMMMTYGLSLAMFEFISWLQNLLRPPARPYCPGMMTNTAL